MGAALGLGPGIRRRSFTFSFNAGDAGGEARMKSGQEPWTGKPAPPRGTLVGDIIHGLHQRGASHMHCINHDDVAWKRDWCRHAYSVALALIGRGSRVIVLITDNSLSERAKWSRAERTCLREHSVNNCILVDGSLSVDQILDVIDQQAPGDLPRTMPTGRHAGRSLVGR